MGAPPLALDPDDRRAWNVYTEAVALSGSDEYGRPSLNMLPLLLETSYPHLSQLERSALLRRLADIHRFVRAVRTEKAIEQMKSR